MVIDINWTSIHRGVGEILFWSVFPILPFNDMFVYRFHLDETYLTSSESKPIVQYIESGENGAQELLDAVNSLDRIVVWKNFIKDSGNHLAKYQDDQYAYDSFNKEDEYDLKANYSNYQHATLKLGDAMKRMNETNDLYLVFSEALTHNNPELAQALLNSYHSHGESFVKKAGLDNAVHVSFMLYGNRYSTPQHNAIISNWLIQVAGTKVWRIVDPRWTPYMRPMQRESTTGLLSAHSFVPNDSKMPYVDITTEPGDLMFFPPHWWHEVHNVYPDEFSFAIGLRTKKTVFPLKWALLPWIAPPGQIIHKLSAPFVLATLPTKSKKVNPTVGSSLRRVQSVYNDFTLNKYEIKGEICSKPYTAQDVAKWRETHEEKMKETEMWRRTEFSKKTEL